MAIIIEKKIHPFVQWQTTALLPMDLNAQWMLMLWPFYSIRNCRILLSSPLFLHSNCISFCFYFHVLFSFSFIGWNGYYNIPDRHELWMFNVHSSVTDYYWRCNLPRDSVFDILIYIFKCTFYMLHCIRFRYLSWCVWNSPKKKLFVVIGKCITFKMKITKFANRLDIRIKWFARFWEVKIIGLRQSFATSLKLFPKLKSFHKTKIS